MFYFMIFTYNKRNKNELILVTFQLGFLLFVERAFSLKTNVWERLITRR